MHTVELHNSLNGRFLPLPPGLRRISKWLSDYTVSGGGNAKISRAVSETGRPHSEHEAGKRQHRLQIPGQGRQPPKRPLSALIWTCRDMYRWWPICMAISNS